MRQIVETPENPVIFELSDLIPTDGTRWILPDAIAPQSGQTIGRDDRSTDTDRGVDWIAQRPSIGERNIIQRQTINDEYLDAIVIPFAPFRDTRATTSASVSENEPLIPAQCSNNINIGHTVWYRYTPLTSGPVTFQTDGSTYDTVLVVRNGNSLAFLDCDDNSGEETRSRLTIQATAGQSYLIMIGSKFGISGDLIFSVQPPPNDDFDNSMSISTLPFSDSQITVAASRAADDPFNCGVLTGRSVWYRYTADTDIQLHLFTEGTDFDTVISVYSGERGNLYNLGCNDMQVSVVSNSKHLLVIHTT